MKNIKKIIFIALIAIFAVACTNEEDFTSNSSDTTFNKKTIIQGESNPYAYFEDKTFTDVQLEDMLGVFNNAVNNNNVTMPDYDIPTALANMEFHFNYGVVVKLPYNKDATHYDKLTFTFSVPIVNNIINGTVLKNAYINFVNSIITQMAGKNLELSDIYVKDYSSTLVTFGLDMEPILVPEGADDAYIPAFIKVKDLNSITIPAEVTSRWDNLPSWSLILPPGYPSDPYYERAAFESVVNYYSFERIPINYNVVGKELIYGHFRENYDKANVKDMYVYNTGSTVIWNSQSINDFVRESIIQANVLNQYASDGFVVYSFVPAVHFTKNYVTPEGLKDKYQLRVQDVRSAKLSYLDINSLFMANVTSPMIEIN